MKKIIESRIQNDPTLFQKQSWKSKPDAELREWTVDCFNQKVQSYPWNKEALIPIIGTVHGTDASVAWKISSSGFAALSSLDNGWYGRGIYFTTSALYALPYFATKPEPSIIVSFVIPGNPYPVTENRGDPESVEGKPISPGYQCNYVHTNRDGTACTEKLDKDFYDELVIEQEAQIVPAFILLIRKETIATAAQRFNRAVATPGPRKKK